MGVGMQKPREIKAGHGMLLGQLRVSVAVQRTKPARSRLFGFYDATLEHRVMDRFARS